MRTIIIPSRSDGAGGEGFRQDSSDENEEKTRRTRRDAPCPGRAAPLGPALLDGGAEALTGVERLGDGDDAILPASDGVRFLVRVEAVDETLGFVRAHVLLRILVRSNGRRALFLLVELGAGTTLGLGALEDALQHFLVLGRAGRAGAALLAPAPLDGRAEAVARGERLGGGDDAIVPATEAFRLIGLVEAFLEVLERIGARWMSEVRR